MTYEEAEGYLFFEKMSHGEVPGIEPPATGDVDRTFDELREAIELEQAGGGPTLPAKETRLRSEPDDHREPLEKFAASTAAGRKKQAISEYIERRRATGASVNQIIRELTEKLESADPELVSLLRGE